MELSAYLDRIQFNGSMRSDLATLRALHIAHQLAVPFENLDVQLKQPVTLDIRDAYRKIVAGRRGGWCYEMNGVFGWALEQMGFNVMRMSAGVMRERQGDTQLGNHLCLLVRLERPYLADVGFGGSLAEPLPLCAMQRTDTPYHITLSEIGDRYWRFSEHTGGSPFSFDFRTDPANETLMSEKCNYLQKGADSTFVQNLVAQRRTADTHVSLRGRVFTITHANREEKSVLNSADELVETLRGKFDLDVPEVATLWPAVCARHEILFAEAAAST